MIRNAITTASTVASTGSSARASACSPRAPIPRLVSVTPSCIAAMNRGGSATIFWTARARLLPSSANSWIFVRRAVTSAYSPATKNAFSRISAATPRSSRKRVTFRPPPAWDLGGRRPRSSPECSDGFCWHNRTRVRILSTVRAEYREEPCKSALNRVKGMMFDWSLNPYMGCVHRCTFCYVRAFERRADRPSDDRYGHSIRVKVNVVDVVRRELARASWKHETVAIGAATDPYQPAEGHYRLTRGCLEALAGAHNAFSIITRGPLIIRDVDVLAEAARRANVSVTFSIPTLDEDVWRKTEPSTAHPRQRLRALKTLVDAGVRASVGMAPVLPGVSHPPAEVAEGDRARREGRARGVWTNVLFLRPGTREHFLENLAQDWPDELERYERLYRRRAYLGKEQTKPLREHVNTLAKEQGLRDRRNIRLEPEPPVIAEQLALAV